MGTSTPAPLTLFKPDDVDLVDVEVHLGDNYDKINDWAIEKDTAQYEFLGGQQRTADSAAIDNDPEVVVCSSGSINLPATSLILVRSRFNFFVGGDSGQDWDFRNRLDNLAGAVAREVVEKYNPTSVPLSYTIDFFYKTVAAESKTWVSTIVRLGGTNGTIVAQAGTSVEVYRVGPSSLLTDFV